MKTPTDAMAKRWLRLMLLVSAIVLISASAYGQTTAFSYQGKLTDSGNLANASYDMQFKLFDALSGGTKIGATLTFDGVGGNPPSVSVSNGSFTVSLDFGSAALSGADRFLEISLRPAGNPGGYQQLLPRQKLSSTPYAVQALKATTATTATTAATATNATQLGGVAASQYVVTSDARMTDARNPLPNSPNYVQNTTSQQAAANFNIGGDGLIGGRLGLGTNGPSAKMQVHTTALDQHLYLSSEAPSLVLGNHEARSSATMNGLFALSTAADHFGVPAGSLTIATYGNARGDIYINSNYSGTGVRNVILQPFGGNVGIGTSTPTFPLHVVGGSNVGIKGQSDYIAIWGVSDQVGGIGVLGDSTDSVGVYGSSLHGHAGYFYGKVVIRDLAIGGSTSLCWNSYPNYEVAYCSSSLRYKTAIQPFVGGLELIKRLRPITFTWKQGGMRDLGFGAEEVEKVEPLLVTYNQKGEVEGVKYDRLTVALVNAAREQQVQIEEQRTLIKQQQREIETLKRRQQEFEALKKLVCADHPKSSVCKSK